MNRIVIASVASLLVLGGALAQQPAPMPGASDPASTSAYKASMMKMMHDMPAFSGDADIDFMKQMRPHHQAAIDMAKVVLANGKDADTKKLAQEIIAAQEKEIAQIDA
jgi:uncharacterized protein (DUF305 family)